ncbi:MAG: response regulator [Candidatus Melainabacteria bacterium]|nr:response regulator [Candidatus Melainabacteria bacterium]
MSDSGAITSINALTQSTPDQTGHSIGTGQKILILDGDTHFRELVKDLLGSVGYQSIEARSAAEGFECVATQHPDMALVDSKLPGMDGIKWITRIREHGNKMPIIFVSGSWLEAKTFKILRNLLNVSLVVQKPIAPHTLLHSVETVLPVQSHEKQIARQLEAKLLIEQNQERQSIEDSQSLQPSADELFQARRLNTQKIIESAKIRYVGKLSEIWSEFVVCVQKARAAHNDFVLIAEARDQAHKLKGSSGSFGLFDLAAIAEKVELMLTSLDPAHTTEQEVIWSEIMRYMAEGSQLQEQLEASNATPEAALAKGVPLSLLVAVGTGFDQSLMLEVCPELGFRPEFVHTTRDLLKLARSRPFDAVIIDMHLDNANLLYHVIGTLRSAPGMIRVPCALIAKEEETLTLARLVYVGCSAIIDQVDDRSALKEALGYLRADCRVNKPRVLCVDDDKLLTHFMEGILKDQGFVTKSLNEPINILETLQEFPPDLILLDVIMPGLTGYEVCRMLRTYEDWQDLPIVFVTAKCDAAGRAAAFEAGGSDFLGKPIHPDELLTRVKAQLALSRRTQSQYETPGLYLPANFIKLLNESVTRLRQNQLPSSLGLIRIDRYDCITEGRGYSGTEHVTATLSNLLAVRFRISDLRCQLDDNLYAVYLPGESAAEAKEALQLLQADWNEVWTLGVYKDFAPHISITIAEANADTYRADKLISAALAQLPRFQVPPVREPMILDDANTAEEST